MSARRRTPSGERQSVSELFVTVHCARRRRDCVRLAMILAAAGFACTGCSRQESSVQRKAVSSTLPRDARSSSEASDPLDVVQESSHSRSASADEHVFYPIEGSSTELSNLPGTVNIHVPPDLLRVVGQSPWEGYALADDLGSSGIAPQLSPELDTPAATAAPLPSTALGGLALLCGVGLAAVVRRWRVRFRTPRAAR